MNDEQPGIAEIKSLLKGYEKVTAIEIYRRQQGETNRCRRIARTRVREQRAEQQFWGWVVVYLAWILVALVA